VVLQVMSEEPFIGVEPLTTPLAARDLACEARILIVVRENHVMQTTPTKQD
jgi:hypothetical protein